MIEVPTKGTGWKMTPPELSLAPLNDLNSAAEIRKIFESRAFSFQEIFLGIVMNNLFVQNKMSDKSYFRIFKNLLEFFFVLRRLFTQAVSADISPSFLCYLFL